MLKKLAALSFLILLAALVSRADDVSESDYRALTDAVRQKLESNVLKLSSGILAKNPSDVRALNLLGIFYYSEEKFGLAKIIFNRALDAQANNQAVLNNLGTVALAQGDQKTAITYFRKALEGDSKSQTARTNISSIYLTYKDYNRALAPLSDAYNAARNDLSKGNAQAMEIANNYAVALQGVGQLNEAKAVYRQILDSGAAKEDIILNYAVLLVEYLKDKSSETSKVLSKLKFAAENSKTKRRLEVLEKEFSAQDSSNSEKN